MRKAIRFLVLVVTATSVLLRTYLECDRYFVGRFPSHPRRPTSKSARLLMRLTLVSKKHSTNSCCGRKRWRKS